MLRRSAYDSSRQSETGGPSPVVVFPHAGLLDRTRADDAERATMSLHPVPTMQRGGEGLHDLRIRAMSFVLFRRNARITQRGRSLSWAQGQDVVRPRQLGSTCMYTRYSGNAVGSEIRQLPQPYVVGKNM